MAAKRIDVGAIHATAEFERIGWEWEATGDNEVRCKCPVPAHQDETPSVNFNVGKNLWQCHAAGCKVKGDIVAFLAYALGVERGLMIEDLKTRYDLEAIRSFNPDTVEKFYDNLPNAGPLLLELEKRGITKEDCREARIGFWKGRLTIPVYDLRRNIINVRRYLPGAPGDKKMQNTPGYGAAAIYQIEDVKKYDKLWFCGGELKARVAKRLLNKHDVGAFSVSAGEGTWKTEWNALLADKTVFVCMDIDQPGRVASQNIGLRIHHAAKDVYIIELPLDKEKYPKGDINDFVGQESASSHDLLSLQEAAEQFVPPEVKAREAVNGSPTDVALADTLLPDNTYRRLRFEGVVFGFFETPFLLPKEVEVFCDRQQSNCALCPIFAKPSIPNRGTVASIPSYHETLIEMVDSPAKVKSAALMRILGIPKCRVVSIEILRQYAVRDVRISPQLSVTSTSSGNNIRLPAYIVDQDVEANSPYELQGVTYSHPKTSAAVLLIDQAKAVEDSMTKFSPVKGDLVSLQSVFAPEEMTVDSIESKLGELYADLSYNVHGIYGRQEMQLIMDLTWHSPLFMRFEGRQLKGWVNSIIVGDSGQGKTEMSVELMNHYGAGCRVECKNATAAGLLGGLQQLGNRWFVSWGMIPQHDRRLVILEEAKGLEPSEIAKMTDMRSSGIAELPKIEHGRANARTRLLFLSNPRSQRTIQSYTYGVEAITQLVGALEDVRRFDIALVVSTSQVDESEINKKRADRKNIEHRATSELCRKLILTAWTRSVNDIDFTDEASDSIQLEASAFAREYSDVIPLLDRGTTREKIARLSAALAARMASYSPDYRLLVTEVHVKFVAKTIRQLYSDPVFGYKSFSDARKTTSKIKDEELVLGELHSLPHPSDAISGLLRIPEITLEDIMAVCDVDKEFGMELVSLFVRKHCIQRSGRFYRKTEAFILFLRRVEEDAPEKSAKEEEF